MLLEENSSTYLIGWGNLVCSLSINMKMMTK